MINITTLKFFLVQKRITNLYNFWKYILSEYYKAKGKKQKKRLQNTIL